MPLPKRKTSHARTTRRRAANWKLQTPNVAPCPRCHAPRLAHHVCPACGFYKNRMVVDVRAKQRTREEEAGEQRQSGEASPE